MFNQIKIDQRKLMPIEQQIAYQLQSLILTRKIADRSVLPGHTHFARHFPIDKQAFQFVLQHLLEQNLVQHHHGEYQVIAPIVPAQAVDDLRGVFSAIKAIGLEPSIQELGLERTVFPKLKFANEAIELDEVWLLKRLFFGSKQPIAIHHSYFPVKLYPHLDQHAFNGQAIYPFLAENFGVHVLKSPRSLSGKALDRVEAELLNYPEGSPALKVHVISSDTQGRLMEFVDLCILADYVSFQEKIV